MAANDPVATVRKMFAAFAAGDLDTLLTTIHPDSKWTYIGANPVISNATFTGRPAVRAFFERILRRLEMSAFNTDEFITSGETVVVFGSEAGTVRATNRPFRNEWVQKYVVSDGLITAMQEYNIQIEPR